MVTIVYFCKGEYLRQTGRVSRIDTAVRVLRVVNTRIKFEDIWAVDSDRIETSCIENP